ncbi:hypothetical protein [Rickettsiella endosymbiont of Miltochrista miniata]
MIKKILLLLLFVSLIAWIASCAWRAPLQVNVPVSWHDSHFKAEQSNTSS